MFHDVVVMISSVAAIEAVNGVMLFRGITRESGADHSGWENLDACFSSVASNFGDALSSEAKRIALR
ncbi:hypothetical protein [Blastopirellula marina]|uniref:Uncharacterized protein n=1 Tax=Blastopirellula marina DSM 3645 TaxID=314230 RepID=A3ZV99_9BACT|nr:hypothetical protein [Blastopirellula marina]EAQ79245.1 hypothetical protein DSM3645_02178 [Blastopirellula marina DSM 3645]